MATAYVQPIACFGNVCSINLETSPLQLLLSPPPPTPSPVGPSSTLLQISNPVETCCTFFIFLLLLLLRAESLSGRIIMGINECGKNPAWLKNWGFVTDMDLNLRGPGFRSQPSELCHSFLHSFEG